MRKAERKGRTTGGLVSGNEDVGKPIKESHLKATALQGLEWVVVSFVCGMGGEGRAVVVLFSVWSH